MPERNVFLMRGLWISDGTDYHYFYYCSIHQETGSLLDLRGQKDMQEFIEGTVNSLIDRKGNVLTLINRKEICKTFTYRSKSDHTLYGILIPDKLARDYGIREGEYLDITLEQTNISGKIEPIFPKILRYGNVDILPKGSRIEASPVLPDVLIEAKFEDPFYQDLVGEVNNAYQSKLLRATSVLVRILLENLLVETLRSKYGMGNLTLFYDQVHHNHWGLSVLIDNLRHRILDFRPYSSSFNDEFLTKLERFKLKGNAAAHAIDEDLRPITLPEWKGDLNYVCNLLVNVVSKLVGKRL